MKNVFTFPSVSNFHWKRILVLPPSFLSLPPFFLSFSLQCKDFFPIFLAFFFFPDEKSATICILVSLYIMCCFSLMLSGFSFYIWVPVFWLRWHKYGFHLFWFMCPEILESINVCPLPNMGLFVSFSSKVFFFPPPSSVFSPSEAVCIVIKTCVVLVTQSCPTLWPYRL